MCHLQAPRRRATCGTAFSILLLSGLCPTSTALLEAPTPGVNKPRWTFRSACGRAFRPQTINVLLSRRTGSSHGGDRLLHKRRASLEAVVEATRLSGGATGAGKDSVSGPRVITEQVGSRTVHVVWDESQGRYVDYASGKSKTDRFRGGIGDLRAFLKHCFIPEDVSPDYFNFTRWRIFQRFVAATVSVLGTQALLLALGIKSRSIGAAAAISWVLKDALGKFVRILWASKMGRRFDSDAKRWRYRSSLLYATGSGLEIVTYVFPSLFLFLATVANALKQMSMLTSSATRNTIYRSFARGENIGDITAKGEAQIACVDLLGLMGGICLSKALGTSRVSIGAAYVLLSAIDIFAIYHEIRSVVFTMLNYERAYLLVCDHLSAPPPPQQRRGSSAAAAAASGLDDALSRPTAVAQRENIFLPAALAPTVFRTVTGAGLTAPRLEGLARAFRGERYLLAYDARVGFSVVLRRDARGADALRALLALGCLERRLRATGALPLRHRFCQEATSGGIRAAEAAASAAAASAAADGGAAEAPRGAQGGGGGGGRVQAAAAAAKAVEEEGALPWEEVVRAATAAQSEAAAGFNAFVDALRRLGWNVDKFMFGNIKCRADWDSAP